ncbi:MAG TPA: UvrD-helicase domain-containing protein [Blastocatellia bacterium]|nr:UvrD-helicase domain-containing protein [Blastocatellia bacterium]
MATWLIPRTELTPEQLRAVEFEPGEHRVIFGAPGSGKTQILLHRARYLCDRWRVSPERFRIFVFTNVLKNYISSALDLLSLPPSCVSTLDYWVVEYYEHHISGNLPWNSAERRPDFALIRQEVLRVLRSSTQAMPQFDFILVDEGQDLDGIAFELLRAIGKHITVCIDHKQQIYDHGSDESEILSRLGMRKKNFALLSAFRCCPFVVRLAAEFVADPKEKDAYLNQARTAQTERETPLLYRAQDFDDEKRRLIEILRVRLAKAEKIGVLLPQKRQVFGFASGFRDAGLEVETQDDLDFSSDLPKLITYHSAKGLTFDTVLLPRLVRSSFSNMKDSRVERLLFVAISRATKWVYMSTTSTSDFGPVHRLEQHQESDWLTIQDGNPSRSTSTRKRDPEPSQSPSNNDDLLGLL